MAKTGTWMKEIGKDYEGLRRGSEISAVSQKFS
jgi:hypothetical protein